VKAKIDNVKVKIHDEEDWGPCKTITGKTSCSRPVGSISGQLTTRGTPSEQFPPRTTSLCVTRQVSALHDKSPPRTTSRSFARAVPVSDWGVGHDTRYDPETQTSSPRHVGGPFPTPCKYTSWWPARTAGPDRSLNTALLGCAAVTSPSSLTLQHASSARGTQAPPTMSSGLRLGLNVAS
jgi:hypothetical protein